MDTDTSSNGPTWLWRFGTAVFDEAASELRVGDQVVDIERRPLDVLACLLRHAGETLTKQELLDAAWPDRVVVENVLSNAIGKLRRALGDSECIATVSGVGYRLTCAVSRQPSSRSRKQVRLVPGDPVPWRTHWILVRSLGDGASNEVWLAQHAKTHEQRVFKFSFDGIRLPALKREVTIYRLLRDSLGERDEFVRIIEWNFEQAPFHIESEYGGENLIDWAGTDHRLQMTPLAERIAWVADVADAIAAAHDLGILHKDIKPANLLVRGEPGRWRPTITDFGSGWLLDTGRLDALGITRLGMSNGPDSSSEGGTPLYLAPELLSGQVPTVRSDLYALGVLLYQMVVGDLFKPLSAGWEQDIDDIILREDIASAANGRPELRPPSARELALSLRSIDGRRRERQRLQEERVQLAQAERRLQLARAGRPWRFAAVLTLAAGMVASLIFYAAAKRESSFAKQQEETASAVVRFLNQDLLSAANPVIGGRADVTLREAIELSESMLATRFADQPGVEAAARMSIGKAFYQLTDYKRAESNFERASELYGGQVTANRNRLESQLWLALTYARAGNAEMASGLLEVAGEDLSSDDATLSDLQALYAFTHANLAFYGALDFPAAVAWLERAEEALNAAPSMDSAMQLTVQQALASAQSRAGNPLEAERSLERIISQLRSERGARHPATLGARHTLARIRVTSGDTRELVPEYQALITDLAEVMGPANDSTVQARYGLAHVYLKLEQWSDAAASARLAFEATSNKASPQAWNGINTYAIALIRAGRRIEGMALLNEYLPSVEAALGSGHLVVAAYKLNLLHALIDEERYLEARPVLDSLEQYALAAIQGNKDAAGELAYLQGRMLAHDGATEAALRRYDEAIALLSAGNPEGYWLLVLSRSARDRVSDLAP